MRRFEFGLPPEPERSHPAWALVSLAIHAVVLAVVVFVIARTEIITRTTTTFIELWEDPASAARTFELPPLIEERPDPEPTQDPPQPEPEPVAQLVVPEPAPPTDRVGRVETVAAPVEPPSSVDPEEGPTPVVGQRRLLGPAYAGGRVWVQPMEAELGVVEASPDRETHAARVAAAVTSLVRAYADTMPADSFATPAPPKWTSTDSQGKTWGVDQQWLYLGDIKIPTLLLALLNLPQGNYYQAREEANLRRIRADIMQAAERIETVESINDYVKEIRRRKDAERALLRAQRAAEAAKKGTIPDTTSHR